MQNKLKKNVRSLWRAVIMQAVVDATSKSKNRRTATRKKRANEWLKEGEHFIETCTLAEMEPHYVQMKVNKYLYDKK